MKKLIFGFCIFICSQLAFGSSSSAQENANISLVKEMWSEYAEKLDNSKLDSYFSKKFILHSNDEQETYDQFNKEQATIYNKLKSLKVTSYDDLIAKDDKVIGRVAIKLTSKQGKSKTYNIIFIAAIKDHKIETIWEVTYPDWDDKLLES